MNNGGKKMVKLLTGDPLRQKMLKNLKQDIQTIKTKGIQPALAIVRMEGRNEALAYENMARKTMDSIGIKTESVTLNANTSLDDMKECIKRLNNNSNIHGILVMQPLASHINRRDIAQLVHPNKDVDGLNPVNLGKLMAGDDNVMYPSTAKAVLELIDYYRLSLKGIDVCIVGSSLVVGRPLSQMLLNRQATVTNCHIHTKDLVAHTSKADVLISATGALELIKDQHVKDNAIVIDVGFGIKNGKKTGDVDFDSVKAKVSQITPVPGGVGSITTVVLAQQVLKATKLLVGAIENDI